MDKSLTKDEALQKAILATELYMKATKLANSEHERSRLRTKCKQLLERAEGIKQSKQWSPANSNDAFLLKVPSSQRAITKREQVILLEGSKLHGFIFPPWTSDPPDSLFESPDGALYAYVLLFK